MTLIDDPTGMAPLDPREALALLEWQVDLGVTDALEAAPVDHYALPATAPRRRLPGRGEQAPGQRSDASRAHTLNRDGAGLQPKAQGAEVDDTAAPNSGHPQPAAPAAFDLDAAVRDATLRAGAAQSLAELAATQAAYAHCDLRLGARSFVFADGNPAARVFILGEAPGRDEDIAGRPFVGRAGQLLDRMFAAIGLARTSPDAGTALYIANVLPWRPPGNRDPEPAEIAMMRPFVMRHIALAGPTLIVVMGNTPLLALTGTKGILRARGHWTEAQGRPVLPMAHPAYLLRNPTAKREAWADLQAVRERLRT